MAPADVTALLRARPFRAFRIVTSDGTTYEVRHPEMVMVSIASLVVGYPDQRQPGVAERYDIVSIRHVIRLEPEPLAEVTEQQPPQQGNGPMPTEGAG